MPRRNLTFSFPSFHDRWDSSAGTTESSLRPKRTGRTAMKAGTGWKRTTETCGEGGPRGANEIRDWVEKDPIARGLARSPAAPLAPVHLVFHMWKRGIYIYRYILHIFWRPDIFSWEVWGSLGESGRTISRERACEVTARRARGHSLWNSANLDGGRSRPAELSGAVGGEPHGHGGDTGGQQNPQGCVA